MSLLTSTIVLAGVTTSFATDVPKMSQGNCPYETNCDLLREPDGDVYIAIIDSEAYIGREKIYDKIISEGTKDLKIELEVSEFLYVDEVAIEKVIGKDYEEILQTKTVEISAWAKPYVETAFNKRVLKDTKLEKEYNFKQNITRLEFSQVVMKYLKASLTEEELSANKMKVLLIPYADTSDLFVLEATQLGIVKGVDDLSSLSNERRFLPNKEISREEVSVMLSRAEKIIHNTKSKEALKINTSQELMKFNDNKEISEWAKDSVAHLVKEKLVDGMGNGKFNPKGQTTREQAIKIIIEGLALRDNSIVISKPEPVIIIPQPEPIPSVPIKVHPITKKEIKQKETVLEKDDKMIREAIARAVNSLANLDAKGYIAEFSPKSEGYSEMALVLELMFAFIGDDEYKTTVDKIDIQKVGIKDDNAFAKVSLTISDYHGTDTGDAIFKLVKERNIWKILSTETMD